MPLKYICTVTELARLDSAVGMYLRLDVIIILIYYVHYPNAGTSSAPSIRAETQSNTFVYEEVDTHGDSEGENTKNGYS